MANIYKTRDRDSKIITKYVETAQSTSSTTPKVVAFNPDYIKGRLNEPYAVEGCLFLDKAGASDHDATLTFDPGAGTLVLEATMVSPTAVTFGGGTNTLSSTDVALEVDNGVLIATGGVMVKLSGTWVPSLRDDVNLTITSGGDSYTIQKGSWLKFTRLSD